jgi:hypothetical protein
MVAGSGLNDALPVFSQYEGYTHIERNSTRPLYIVKGIMQNATNLGQLHLKNAIVVEV